MAVSIPMHVLAGIAHLFAGKALRKQLVREILRNAGLYRSIYTALLRFVYPSS